MSDNEVVISDVYLYISLPSFQMSGWDDAGEETRRNTQENQMLNHDGGNVE